MAEHDEKALIVQFCDLTGASPEDAQNYLEVNRWDLPSAAAEYYTSQEEEEVGDEAPPTQAAPEVSENYTGPRTLDGRPAPTSAIPTVASSSRPVRQPPRTGIATLGSLGSGGGPTDHRQAHVDDDDSEDEDYHDDKEPRDLFAGGEKSGLAVQDPSRRNTNPRHVVNDIIKRAKANSQKSDAASPSSSRTRSSRFRGSGQTLGGDDTPSQVIPDPNAPEESAAGSVQHRVLHLWSDGFSIDDGPLHRFDDPQNRADLEVIRSGRAPTHLMNVEPNQPLDVHLNKHDEDYKPLPKVYKPFSGGGRRLASPTPGLSIPLTPSPIAAPSETTIATSSTSSGIDINPAQPTLSIRIQLANGTRLPARFNTTHTIGDVYGFISQASSGSNNRPWVLATTFPNKDHTDQSAVLGELPEFKKGGMAVQKWV